MKWNLACGVAMAVVLSGEPFGPPNGPGPFEPRSAESRDRFPVSDAPDARPPTRRPQFVREAQRTLRDLGYAPGAIDGSVGPRTRAALAMYQEAEKLPVTGELDAETMARLDISRRLFRPRGS